MLALRRAAHRARGRCGRHVPRPSAPWFLSSELSLIPFYAVLAMPFTYRALDAGIRAIDLRTLVDASRSLGAGWLTTLCRVLIPNLTSAIIGSALPHRDRGPRRVHHRLVAPEADAAHLPRHFTRTASRRVGMALALVVFLATALLLALFITVTRRPGSRALVRDLDDPPSTRMRHGHLVVRRQCARRSGRPSRSTTRPRPGGRRAGQPPRPERLRQDHGAADRGWFRVARRRSRRVGGVDISNTPPEQAATWGWCSRATACSPT